MKVRENRLVFDLREDPLFPLVLYLSSSFDPLHLESTIKHPLLLFQAASPRNRTILMREDDLTVCNLLAESLVGEEVLGRKYE